MPLPVRSRSFLTPRSRPVGWLWGGLTLLSVLLTPLSARAQTKQHVAKFTIQPSPLTLRGDVRPHQYVGVVGRKAAWLGTETGEAELWVHPLKLASRFSVDFQIPDYLDPVRGTDVARSVEVRPELTTITYTHATFTVREHILAPLDEPGLLVLLDVSTIGPLEVIVSFRSLLQYAWPGGLGGQYVSWNDAAKAFVLSESRRQHNGLIGSPWAATASSHPAHALPEAPSTFRIPIDPNRAQREFVPIAIAAGIAPRDEVTSTYRRMIEQASEIYQRRRQHEVELLESTARVDTPDDQLNLALAWATVNLDEQLVCNPDLGCGLVAGWGPSGPSARPGFGWFFGGDAAINSLAMSSIGMSPAVEGGLRFLAKYQRDDGKVPHEISQAAGRLPWFTDFPYAYYHADTTPHWIVAVWKSWRSSGNQTFISELWPAVRKAYQWCLTTETDGDGIIENTSGGLGAIEVGALGENIHQDIYLAAVWIEALEAVKEMASAMNETKMAEQAMALGVKATASLNEKYWLQAAGHHAFGILAGGKLNDSLTVWPATAAAFGLLERDRAVRTLVALTGHRMSADWGSRMLSTDNPLYGPTEYNMGAVWPFVTGFVAWGQYNYQRSWAGYPLIEALAHLTFDWARGRHPELLSGAYYRPLDTAVPHQFFATSMLVTPLMSGLLGWSPDAPHQRAWLAPQLPPQWPTVTVRHLRVGASSVSATIEQKPGRLLARLKAEGPELQLSYAPSLPLGARRVRVTIDGKRAAWNVTAGRTDRHGIELSLAGAERTVEVTWDGGLSVEPPALSLEPGQTSQSLRILELEAVSEGWRLTVEGLAGETYDLYVHGQRPTQARGAEVLDYRDGVTRLRISLPEGSFPTASAELALFER